METREGLIDKEKTFLKSLEARLHRMEGTICHLGGREIRGMRDDYIEGETLSREEIQEVLRIVKSSRDLILFPINGPFGFYPAYEVASVNCIVPGVEPEINYLLRFSNKQLPKGYSFEMLSETFTSKRNLELAQIAEISFDKNESAYQY